MSDSPASMREEVVNSPRSRKQFLKGAAVVAATVGLAPGAVSAAALRGGGGPGMGETTQTILDVAATAEALAVTALYHVHMAVNQGKLSTAGVKVPVPYLIGIVRAILREEQDHLAFLVGAGGKPLVTSFTLPPDIFRSATAALKFLGIAEPVFIAAYMAANREWADAGMGQLAQYAYQIGGTEAEHRALARAGLGNKPPNNKSFETSMFSKVSDAATVLEKLGLLKPNMQYPGAHAVDHILSSTFGKNASAAVIQRHP